ncbi:hypothetical protein McpSp1_11530 [Methanocorpusculaceae archaeon Sp1]|nr:hypothetical protein [Methanocorpusculaceae archaeon Sp1]
MTNKKIFEEIVMVLEQYRSQDYPDLPSELIEQLIMAENEHLTDVDSTNSLSETRKIINAFLEEK